MRFESGACAYQGLRPRRAGGRICRTAATVATVVVGNAVVRILHVTEALAAGVGRHVCDLATGLTARGHQIEVLYSPARADPLLLDELLATPHVRTCAVRMRRAPHLSDFAAGAH